MAIADGLGARYELGMAYMEIGQRMGRHDYLQRAQAIFTEIGALPDRWTQGGFSPNVPG